MPEWGSCVLSGKVEGYTAQQIMNVGDDSVSSKEVVSVVVVEDQPQTRAKLVDIIHEQAQFKLVGEAGDCATALTLIKEQKPDVLLVDLGLPDGSGIDVIGTTRLISPKTEMMVITSFGDEKHVVSAIEAGATGYLLKDGAAETIVSSMLDMLAGGSPISPSIARYLLKRFQPQQPEPNEDAPKLTTREREVLEFVAKGFAYAEIANLLDMSTHTVTSHIKSIYRKLSVNSRGQAVFEAMQLGLIKRPN